MGPAHESDFTDGQVLLANVSSFLHSLEKGHYVTILFSFFLFFLFSKRKLGGGQRGQFDQCKLYLLLEELPGV